MRVGGLAYKLSWLGGQANGVLVLIENLNSDVYFFTHNV